MEHREASVNLPRVNQEVEAGSSKEVESESSKGEISSIKKENYQVYLVVEREYDTDICSLLESSGHSSENQPFPALRFREPSCSSGESGTSMEQGNLLGLEDTEEMGSSSAVDCEPLGHFFLNTTEEGRLEELDPEKNQARMLLDMGSSDEEVCLVKASYVPQIESDNILPNLVGLQI